LILRLLRYVAVGLIGLIAVIKVVLVETFREDVAAGLYNGGTVPSQDIVLLFIGFGATVIGLAIFLLVTKP
jgi:hypothetical protein